MFIAGKMLDNTIRPALSVLSAALHLPPTHKLSETGFPALLIRSKDIHRQGGGHVMGRGKGYYEDCGRRRNPQTENAHILTCREGRRSRIYSVVHQCSQNKELQNIRMGILGYPLSIVTRYQLLHILYSMLIRNKQESINRLNLFNLQKILQYMKNHKSAKNV